MRYEIPQTGFMGSSPYLCPECDGTCRVIFQTSEHEADWDWCLYCDVSGWIEDNHTTLIVQRNRNGLIACPIDNLLDPDETEYLLTMTTEGENDDLKAIIDMWFNNIQTIGGNIIDVEFSVWPR